MPSEPTHGHRAGILVGLLTSLGVLSIELSLADPNDPAWLPLLKASLWLVPSVVVRAWLTRKPHRRGRTNHTASRWPTLMLLVLSLAPFMAHGTTDDSMWLSLPLELVLLASLRNLSCGLYALSPILRLAGCEVLVASVAVGIATLLTDSRMIVVVAGCYMTAATLWLIAACWSRQSRAATMRTLCRPSAPVSVCVIGLVVGAAACGGMMPDRMAWTLGEWLPSSGGSAREHSAARSGIGDGSDSSGDGQDPDSTGFGGDSFRESRSPSLYDVMTEVYGTPRPPEEVQRAISLSPDKVKFRERLRITQNGRAGREFTLLRNNSPPRGTSRDVAADALLYIKGRTPLHLKLVVYDRFDGVSWYEAVDHGTSSVTLLGADCWMQPAIIPQAELFADHVRHEIKTGLMESKRIPVPCHLERFRIDKVDEPSFFRSNANGLLAMVRTVPGATTIEVSSAVVDPEQLPGVLLAGGANAPRVHNRDSEPVYVPPGVAAEVTKWASGVPRGWAQVERCVECIRRTCVLDAGWGSPPPEQDVTEQFLLQDRRGTHLQFASCTAIALHSLGYRVRLVSGFYASPDDFNHATGHTPIQSKDAHFWVEVRLADGGWVTVDPAPGHDVLKPGRSWGSWFYDAVHIAWSNVMSHGLLIATCAVAVAMIYLARVPLIDAVLTVAWNLARVAARGGPMLTLWLLEHRCRLAGCPRPSGMTPSRWFGSFTDDNDQQVTCSLRLVLASAAWLAFAPKERVCPWSAFELDAACRNTVHHWNVRRVRRVLAERRTVA